MQPLCLIHRRSARCPLLQAHCRRRYMYIIIHADWVGLLSPHHSLGRRAPTRVYIFPLPEEDFFAVMLVFFFKYDQVVWLFPGQAIWVCCCRNASSSNHPPWCGHREHHAKPRTEPRCILVGSLLRLYTGMLFSRARAPPP